MNYLFDFDGTLVDSMPTYAGLMLRILDENGMKYPDDIVKTITPLGFIGTARHYVAMGVKRTEQQLVERMLELAVDAYTHHVPAKPHVIDTLRQLHARGDRMSVLTASPHASLDPCLKRLGIYDLFDNVWSCDDFATTKADPDIYRRAAQCMGVEVGDVLFLDDNLNADRVAKSAGMRVCGVYDDTSADYVDEMKAATDYYIYDFAELPGLIR